MIYEGQKEKDNDTFSEYLIYFSAVSKVIVFFIYSGERKKNEVYCKEKIELSFEMNRIYFKFLHFLFPNIQTPDYFRPQC